MSLLGSEFWQPDPAKPTGTYTPRAGVTPIKSVQITNNTLWNLLINDSSMIPDAPANSRYIVPPRCTAQFPIGTPTLSFRWQGLLATPGDLVTFVFSDTDAPPQVWPGTIPTGSLASPVQSAAFDRSNTGGLPLTLTTTSGLNIGQLFIHNNSGVMVHVAIGPPFHSVNVRAYSWVCLPLNVPSGGATLSVAGGLTNVFLTNDSLYVSWSDINYLSPFPSGAGRLPDPVASPSADIALGSPQVIQFTAMNGWNPAGTTTMYDLGPVAGSAVQRIVIDGFAMSVTSSGAPGGWQISASAGYDGLSAGVVLWDIAYDAGGKNGGISGPASIVIANLHATNHNIIQATNLGTPTQMWGGIWGRILS